MKRFKPIKVFHLNFGEGWWFGNKVFFPGFTIVPFWFVCENLEYASTGKERKSVKEIVIAGVKNVKNRKTNEYNDNHRNCSNRAGITYLLYVQWNTSRYSSSTTPVARLEVKYRNSRRES